jgi:spore maturation protein CgeB
MRALCIFPKYNYGVSSRGVGIETTSFLPAFESLGYEVRLIDSWDASTYPTYAALNRAILEMVESWQPDVVFTVQRNYEIWLETLDAIAQRNDAVLVTWITDDSFKFHDHSRFIGPHYDAISTTYDYRMADYERAGIHGAIYTQWAANAEWLAPPRPAVECAHRVLFLGTNYGGRQEVIERLQASGIDVACFGFGWPNGPVDTADLPRLMRDSVICLNLSGGFQSSGGHDRQLKARAFEVPGSGGFLLTEPAPGIDRFYRIGEEIDVFDGQEDLERKIRFYLDNPQLRDEIAMRGFERTRYEHLYPQRLSKILEFAFRRRAERVKHAIASNARLPTGSIFAGVQLNLAERIYRSLLLFLCQRVWGERGANAARRFTFAASVRLLGARTFTSRGLPGRLFPYV